MGPGRRVERGRRELDNPSADELEGSARLVTFEAVRERDG